MSQATTPIANAPRSNLSQDARPTAVPSRETTQATGALAATANFGAKSWPWSELTIAVAEAAQRSDAAERIVHFIASRFPDHAVRWGWGTCDSDDRVSMHRLYDARLGWLGSDNTVYQTLRKQFETATESEESGEVVVSWNSANLTIAIRIPDQTIDHADQDTAGESRPTQPIRQAILWVRPPEYGSESLQAFARNIPSNELRQLSAVFFSRPATLRFSKLATRLNHLWSYRGLIGIAILLTILIGFIPIQYRVTANASVTAMNSRLVASPIAATLARVHVRPGDPVQAGQPLLELDGRPLRIELEAINAEIETITKDEDISLAGGQIAEAQLAGLRRRALLRRRELIQDKLEKLVVTSPIDGIVIQGDLQQTLGTPLEIGKSLLEIAPANSVEIELEIPEVEIGFVQRASEVDLWFPAVTRSPNRTQIKTIWPASDIREDENVFIAKASMPRNDNASSDHPDSGLRVGMRGEAIVYGPARPWVWKWIRTPVHRLAWMFGW